MKTTEEILATLSKYEVESDWRDKALWRRNNRYWLRYSQYMAMIVLDRLDELGLTQKQLAERMGCSAQYISKIMKGSENLTLETIAKLEASLDLDIFKRVSVLKGKYEAEVPSIRYVAESEELEYGKSKK